MRLFDSFLNTITRKKFRLNHQKNFSVWTLGRIPWKGWVLKVSEVKPKNVAASEAAREGLVGLWKMSVVENNGKCAHSSKFLLSSWLVQQLVPEVLLFRSGRTASEAVEAGVVLIVSLHASSCSQWPLPLACRRQQQLGLQSRLLLYAAPPLAVSTASTASNSSSSLRPPQRKLRFQSKS